MLASMIARASTSRARVVSSSSSASSSFEFSASFARAAQKHQLHHRVRISPRRTHLNGIHEQQDRSNNSEEAHDNDGKDHPSNPRSSVNKLNTLLRESRRKSKPNMSDEDREEALEQMRELFIQYPKEGRVVGELVKQLENYSRWDTNTNNNARKEALEALEVHSEIVMEENVSSAT